MVKKIIAPKKGKKKNIFNRKMKKVFDEQAAGKLTIGKSNKKVKSRAQTIAIALSEATKAVKSKSTKKIKSNQKSKRR